MTTHNKAVRRSACTGVLIGSIRESGRTERLCGENHLCLRHGCTATLCLCPLDMDDPPRKPPPTTAEGWEELARNAHAALSRLVVAMRADPEALWSNGVYQALVDAEKALDRVLLADGK